MTAALCERNQAAPRLCALLALCACVATGGEAPAQQADEPPPTPDEAADVAEPAQTAAPAAAAAVAAGCTPGQQVACACPDRRQSVQVCAADGASFEPCYCPQAARPRAAPPPLAPRYTAPLPVRAERPYEEGDPIPQGYHLDTKISKGWVVAGLTTFGGLYVLGGITASIIDNDPPTTCSADGLRCEESNAHRWLYAPIFGPFVTAATNPDDRDDRWTWILVMDGILQTAGVAATIAAIAAPDDILVSNVAIAPIAVDGGMGIGLRGEL